MSDWSEDVPHVCSAACIQSPAETLALIAEHRLTVKPLSDGWFATTKPYVTKPYVSEEGSRGSTIGDAVRACVERIKAAK